MPQSDPPPFDAEEVKLRARDFIKRYGFKKAAVRKAMERQVGAGKRTHFWYLVAQEIRRMK